MWKIEKREMREYWKELAWGFETKKEAEKALKERTNPNDKKFRVVEEPIIKGEWDA